MPYLQQATGVELHHALFPSLPRGDFGPGRHQEGPVRVHYLQQPTGHHFWEYFGTYVLGHGVEAHMHQNGHNL